MSSTSAHSQDPEFYISGILAADIAVLSRAITLVESSKESHQQLARAIIDGVMHKTGNSFRLGITGVPGVGKSTFIESFGLELLKHKHKVAVLAIDPSSTKSKGSILGDKTRMEKLSAAPDVFIRPSPSSGTLGGITRVTYETQLLCEAAGFDFIIIETVGVGQSEVAVSRITDFFLLLMLAGAGDELQGIKRGIMEMADALVITKADGANHQKAKAARAEYAHAMHLLREPESGWGPETMICSALENYGIDQVYRRLQDYRNHVTASGYFSEKRRAQQYELFLNAIDDQLKQRFYSIAGVKDKIKAIESLQSTQNIQPFALAKQVLDEFFPKGS